MVLAGTGDSVALNGTTGTITLNGGDLNVFPAAKYGTVALAAAQGITSLNDTTSSAILSAVGNAAATTFDFGSGIVGGTDAVNAVLKYTGFKTYVASSHGDTVTLSASGPNVTGGTGADTLNGRPGAPTVCGRAGGHLQRDGGHTSPSAISRRRRRVS